MKNIILVLLSILMVVFGILTLACSGYDYAAEKLFYRAMKANSKIRANGDTPAPRLMRYVEKNLKTIIRKHPKATIAEQAHFVLAEFYIQNRLYDQALPTLYDIMNAYPEKKGMLAGAHFLKGMAFEQMGEWNKALREFETVRDKYTESPIALRVPLYIADHYKEQQDYDQADQAYKQALRFYKREEMKSRGTARGYAAANSLMQVHMELEQYEQAGEVVEKTVHLYPKLLPLAQQLVSIDLIFIKKLNKPDKAIELYETIRVRTDDPKLTAILDEKIRVLEAQQ